MRANREVGKFLRQAKQERRKNIKKWLARVKYPPGTKIQCRGIGCVGCCYQLVVAHLWEGMLIAKYLWDSGQEQLLLRAAEAGEKAGEFVGPDYTPGQLKAATAPYLDARIPCVFLGADERCQIYGLRPAACASYFVVTDPERCYASSGTQVGMVNASQIIAWGFEAEGQLMDLLFPGAQPFVVPMPLGAAVAMGSQVLTDGPGALSQMKTMKGGAFVQDA